jgi:short chain dehydrogenase
MGRIFITGSTDGLGRATARTLMEEGHHVVLHTRSRERAPAVADLALRSAGVVIGDLSSAVETRKIAEQVNGIGRIDAVIHNAGTYLEPSRGARGSCENPHSQHPGAVHADGADRASRSIDLSQQQHASRRRRFTARHRLGRAALGPEPGLLRKQALRRSARLRGRSALARCSEQRCRSGLGADQDGRPRSAGRSRDGTPYPDVARGQRRSRRDSQRRILVSPPAADSCRRSV